MAGLHIVLARESATMALDVYADLFDDDLDDVAKALNHARKRSTVVKSVVKPKSID
ncbi:hypothetical protein [Humibacter antri]